MNFLSSSSKLEHNKKNLVSYFYYLNLHFFSAFLFTDTIGFTKVSVLWIVSKRKFFFTDEAWLYNVTNFYKEILITEKKSYTEWSRNLTFMIV